MSTLYPPDGTPDERLVWARSQRTGKIARKAVLLAITEAVCDPSTTEHPSPTLLAQQTEQAEWRVRDHLAWLVDNRVIRWTSVNDRNHYDLILSTHLTDTHERIATLLREAADLWVLVESPDLVRGSASNRFIHAAEAAWFDARDSLPPKPLEPRPPAAGCYVYRLWQPDGRLLYVGVSVNLRARLKSHKRRWGDLWERATWEEYPDEMSMLAAEAAAIRDEDPALNRAGVG